MSDPMRPLKADIHRFWAKVEIGAADECWLWKAYCGSTGYGRFWYRGRSFTAHRVAWMLENGAIPSGMFVCHHCDTPLCVNPAHLFLGTNTDNILDCARKGRADSTLTAAAVMKMRTLHFSGNYSAAELGRMMGVTRSNAWLIVRGKTWQHVPMGKELCK